MTDLKSYLQQENAREARFHGNTGKVDRELWIAREFARHISDACGDLLSVQSNDKQDSAWDVRIGVALFQITVLQDNSQRLQEYATKTAQRLRDAESLENVVWYCPAHDTPECVNDPMNLLLECAKNKRKRYGNVANINLLIYAIRTNMARVHPARMTDDYRKKFMEIGFESVCVLQGVQAIVLYGPLSSPTFIKQVAMERD